VGAGAAFPIILGLPWNLTPAPLAVQLAQLFNMFLLAFFVALGHALAFGLPVGLVVQKLKLAGALTAAVGGFVIGALPLTLLFSLTPPPEYSSSGGKVTSINGARTLDGWWDILTGAGLYGLCGVVGGLCAWLFWSWSFGRPIDDHFPQV
jgi:hypothetical protein